MIVAKAEKVEALKLKLKKKAQEAKNVIEKALGLGEIEKVKNLQELNIKVLTAVFEDNEV